MNKPGRPISLMSRPISGKTESQATAEWSAEATRLLKRALRDCGWGYKELAEALQTEGIHKTPTVLNRRINRGNFTAGFMLVCLSVMPVSLEVRTKHPVSPYFQLIQL